MKVTNILSPQKLNSKPTNNDYDMEDVSLSIVEALREVGNYLDGKKGLSSTFNFFYRLDE